MDFLSQIKSNVTDKTISNLATFLGEETSAVASGFSLCTNSFVAGLLKYAHSDVELKNIVNILIDGGHTGDILNNVEAFSGNFEKTQLLVTIGSNISSHFLGNKVPLLVEKIAGISEVRKTSANSLLSLSAPIVLGYIGKLMKDKNFDISGLRNYFREINDNVINVLPPAINNIFQFKKISTQQNSKVVLEKSIVEKARTSKKTNWGLILPWVILAIAGFSVLYYAKFGNKSNKKGGIITPMYKDSTAEDLRPEDFMPDASSNDTSKINIVPVPVNSDLKTDEKNSVSNTVPDSKDQPEIKKTESVLPEKPKSVTSKDTDKITQKVENPKTTTSIQQKTDTESKAIKNITPSGWNTIFSNIFKNNSAEINNKSGVNSIFSQLKNSSKTINISPLNTGNRRLSEDRAYALREMLIEKGIPESQIEITSSLSGSNANGIVYKIQN
ncbi:DUF937 domain-containing protein [Lacihabitans sp. LS3-19]|uniref:DUF937 domain-containing protein n=1 Tax=Lacihabitans sp. LS3-19 TaxID=2487335 RepID=UPI0020CE11C2|nr:DUF937 domain-containing protein [Lacihabitans sp. LS3-19]MCP9769025.1 DUF937 domain-containing protein [Lacihabitans sp. LS3-19]